MTERGVGAGPEIESLSEFDAIIAAGHTLHGAVIQSLDLRERAAALASVGVRGAVFLGCWLPIGREADLRRRGAVIFPRLTGLPFNPYRPRLYTSSVLYDALIRGGDYDECTDARIYQWLREHGKAPPVRASIAMSLHDHAISDSLDDLLDESGIVEREHVIGIMGGHAAERGSGQYRQAARLAAEVTEQGWTVLTGGGPGAMEAANLGAQLAGQPERLTECLHVLSTAPDFAEDITAWAKVALQVRSSYRSRTVSLGVPTWFYGDEPPNPFASHIAKFFSNALREDILLTLCRGGLIYLPGAAGTVQEIFQAATGNYYASADEPIVPMVLVGTRYWSERMPAWQLLSHLGEGRDMAAHVHLVDSVPEAAEVLGTPHG